MSTWRFIWLCVLLGFVGLGCSEDSSPAPDSGTTVDGGTRGDAGTTPDDAGSDEDAGPADAGSDAGAPPADAGAADSGVDAGAPPADAGSDAGTAPDDAGSDGGTEPADAGTDAGPTDDAVHVWRFTRYRTASGITEQPEDFTRNPVELFVMDGTALVPVPGRAGVPGEYVFPDVPRGEYYLKVGTTYVVTDARSIDLSIHTLGRPDIQTREHPPLANLALFVDPWYPAPEGPFFPENTRSKLQLLSEELGFMADITPDNLDYGVEYVSRSVDLLLGTAAMMPRFEEARGDRARVVQLSPHPLPGATLPDGGVQHYVSAVRALHLPPFSNDGTQALPVEGRLEPLAMQELPLDWKVSAFAAHATEVNPAAVLRDSSFNLYPAAHGLAEGWFGFSGELLQLRRPIGLGADVSGSATYGNPYPADWGLVAAYVSPFSVTAQPSSGAPFRMVASLGVFHPFVPGGDTGPLVPRILPPRGLTVDGAAAYSARTLSAGAHVIGWQPPEGASASAYVVTVQHRTFRSDGVAIIETAARLQTNGSATSVQLPAGVLQPHQLYYVIVRAVLAEGYAPDKPLMLSRLPEYSYAEALSGLLTTAAAAP